MRLRALVICLASLFLAAGGIAADDLDKLAGTWNLVSAERDGKPLPKEEFDNDVSVTVSKVERGECQSIVKKGGKVVDEAAITNLKMVAENYQYDMAFIQGPQKGKILRGIVRVDGDTMTTCWHGGEGYPTRYTGAKGSGCALRILKRVQNDLDNLSGTWNLVALERDGQPVPKDTVADELVFSCVPGEESVWHVAVVDRGKIRAEATIQPTKGEKGEKDDDITYTKFDVAYSKGRHTGKTLHAFIHLDGDTLKAFWTKPDEGGERAEKTFHTFKRAVDGDAAKLPGTWKHIAAERDGKPLPKEEFDKYPTQLAITRGEGAKGEFKVVMKMGEEVVAEAAIKRSAGEKGAKDNQYEAAYSKGRHAGTTLHATIQLDGDTLKACWSRPDERGDGTSQTCHTFNRVKE